MRVLIIDDSEVWIRQGAKLLEAIGHEVSSLLITEPEEYVTSDLPEDVFKALKTDVDLLMIDKDLGEGITSTPLLCVIRQKMPSFPIIRWTGGYERTSHMQWLHVSVIDKPTKQDEEKFAEKFAAAFEEQRMLHAGPMFLFHSLKETAAAKDDSAMKEREQQMRQRRIGQLAEIVGLAKKGVFRVPNWAVEGHAGGVTMHEFGHAICDGQLVAEDIRPFLPGLQKVVAKMRELDTVDRRFEICASFIEAGDLDELELVRGCY